ncbi:hypothetical protein QBC46DRAFT_346280 [Diplogelasinospora grovesii]|uniref:Uncharacterized protein n=1 Tax=Diplogelasinospora grovesii TaxID=303347 RepID=A0AAN6S096_9PEZI|nr:hypothetical protein QBC46DRAFT_346280 [Diplogelasinospora grovesii]
MFAAGKLHTWFDILIFGPAYALLPSREDMDRQSEDTNFEFNFDVRGDRITFTAVVLS